MNAQFDLFAVKTDNSFNYCRYCIILLMSFNYLFTIYPTIWVLYKKNFLRQKLCICEQTLTNGLKIKQSQFGKVVDLWRVEYPSTICLFEIFNVVYQS